MQQRGRLVYAYRAKLICLRHRLILDPCEAFRRAPFCIFFLIVPLCLLLLCGCVLGTLFCSEGMLQQ